MLYSPTSSLGFTADVALSRIAISSARSSRLLLCVFQSASPSFAGVPLHFALIRSGRDIRRSLFSLTFNNSKYTGGTMLQSRLTRELHRGYIEFGRWVPLPPRPAPHSAAALPDGSHIASSTLVASRGSSRPISTLPFPVDVLIDGENETLSGNHRLLPSRRLWRGR